MYEQSIIDSLVNKVDFSLKIGLIEHKFIYSPHNVDSINSLGNSSKVNLFIYFVILVVLVSILSCSLGLVDPLTFFQYLFMFIK
jgi:hypothetical protein